MNKTPRKKLIEVALPLDAINKACAREKMPGIKKHPRGLHLWWARRPLAAARAVIFAQMVDDPSSCPEEFPTESEQDAERQRLHRLIEELVVWENTTDERVLESARVEIQQSWQRACADHADHLEASEFFDPTCVPAFQDPFAGGGALPLEAQRLGLKAHASDLNPVAVLINKALIEIPPKFSGQPPINPDTRKKRGFVKDGWSGAEGLAEDIRYYGRWMRDEAERRIGYLYPRIKITREMTRERPDLKAYEGRDLTVVAWLWARTVSSPNPAFSEVEVPLVSNFMLSTKKGKQAYVKPILEGSGYRFIVRGGSPPDLEVAKAGTKLSPGAHFRCLISETPLSPGYVKSEGRAGRMGARLMAIVAKGDRQRIYLKPTSAHETAADEARPRWTPEGSVPKQLTGGTCHGYGLTTFGDLFTRRQLVALTTFSDLVIKIPERVRHDAVASGLPDDKQPLRDGGAGATAYGEVLAIYLALAIDRLADYNSTIATWKPSGQQVMQTFKRQAIPMTWDFPESNVLGDSAICWHNAVKYTAQSLEKLPSKASGRACQRDAMSIRSAVRRIISTDPPYYDNVGYADLSDYFYVWLRRSLKPILPRLFSTLTVPKTEELVAMAYRHGDKVKAESFFLRGMTKAMMGLASRTHPWTPVTIYYAFKQTEGKAARGNRSTAWETFLEAVIRAGFSITGTWPMRTELRVRMIGMGANALASSIVLVCRKRPPDAPLATRHEFATALRAELPAQVAHLRSGNIAPVDFAQAAIGPGMGIYSRYSKVLDATGKHVSVGVALALINEVLDEILTEREGEFDPDTRWAIAWYEEHGFGQGKFGVAETLSKAKNTSVIGMVEAGIIKLGAGEVRLRRPSELPRDWDPATDTRLVAWEAVHQLVRALEGGGEAAAAKLVRRLGGVADTAHDLAYRLYSMAEKTRRPQEALQYNALVQSWPEIVRLSRILSPSSQTELL